MNQPDKNDNCDRFLKIRTLFDQRNDAYAKFYIPCEYLALNEVTVLFKWSYFQATYSYQIQMLWYKDLQTLQHDRICIQYDNLVGKGQAKKCNTDDDTYTCDNEKFD
jgi:hypothetical protein